MSLLVVDDEALWCSSVADYLRRDVGSVQQAGSVAEARERLGPDLRVVLLDQQLPDGAGLSLVPAVRRHAPDARILVVTGHPLLADAVEALRLRIDDYLTKPLDLERVRHAVLRSLEMVRLELAEARERHRDEQERHVARIVGPGLEGVRRLVQQVGSSQSPVLITGETGVGKTLVAKSLHYSGPPGRPFVHLNCAALPENLVEAELFGVEKGAFTGAEGSRPGMFELADGGTLLLDEIGELPLPLQAKLLGVLEEGQARRVGGTRPRSFRVRILSATNIDVQRAVEGHRLRRDLVYRLSVVPLSIPPLRERPGDLPELVDALLGSGIGCDSRRPCRLAPGEMERLQAYRWPGNVRELRNLLERSVLLQDPRALCPSALLPEDGSVSPPPATVTAERAGPEGGDGPGSGPMPTLAEVERRHILDTLERLDGHRQRTADALDIGVATLRRKLSAYRSI